MGMGQVVLGGGELAARLSLGGTAGSSCSTCSIQSSNGAGRPPGRFPDCVQGKRPPGRPQAEQGLQGGASGSSPQRAPQWRGEGTDQMGVAAGRGSLGEQVTHVQEDPRGAGNTAQNAAACEFREADVQKWADRELEFVLLPPPGRSC